MLDAPRRMCHSTLLEDVAMAIKFSIERVQGKHPSGQMKWFLAKDTDAYYHQDYVGWNQLGNPDFLNDLKNTFGKEGLSALENARQRVLDILKEDIPAIIREHEMSSGCMLVCVPRAKAEAGFSRKVLELEGRQVESRSLFMFKDACRSAADALNIIDGTDCVVRIKDTQTTHLGRKPKTGNLILDFYKGGQEPYPGITKDTCVIKKDKIEDKHIILIDDIYTRTVNIDEDCIQALYDNGATKVVFYAIGRTI
jgi:hypothetical protein